MSEPAKRRFSLARFVLWSLGGLVVLGIGLFGLDQARTSRRMKTTVAHLDETDPGWRPEEIEAARPDLPDAQNSAILCRKLTRALGGKWIDQKFGETMDGVPMPELLDDVRMKLLREEMVRLAPVLRTAYPLADMPKGKHRIDYAFHPLATRLNDQQAVRQIPELLRFQALYLANEGDASGAVRSCRACVCAGRSLFDEPFLVSQLIRMACVSVGANTVERSLSLGEVSEAELVALDELLADEGKHNSLLIALRGDRATMVQLFSRLGSGVLSADGLHDELGIGEGSLLRRITPYPRWQVRRQEPFMLDAMTRLVDNARLPSHEQIVGEEEIDREIKARKLSGDLVASLMPAPVKIGGAFRRKAAYVSAIRGLIAVERYRMKHGKWPAKLADLVPEFLASVPIDPFDGTPMKLVKLTDGVIVYSVGYDGIDDGGKLDRKNPIKPGTDLGFQLWDVAKRRRPASSPKEAQP